ncbi:MAG: hypothetical protein ABIJ18_04795 [archaeon]
MNDKVELTDKKIEELQRQPIIESSMFKSMDGKWFIHKTTTTSIKPVSYVEKVMES